MSPQEFTVIKTFMKRILWELEISNGKEPSLEVPLMYSASDEQTKKEFDKIIKRNKKQLEEHRKAVEAKKHVAPMGFDGM